MKRIIICCDGTWNLPDSQINGLPIQTNVAKIANAVLEQSAGIQQLMFYEPGVGTHGSWLRRMIDGATGNGLSKNMLNAYRYLVHNYELGDELFLFGFSRGAFTVRTLAGMIRNCGIIRRNALDKVEQGFELYSSRKLASHPRLIESTLFRRTYSVADIIPIKFIGVWDTVGALGNPLLLNGIVTKRHSFHDYKLSSFVEQAYHAIAIDEHRRQFQPALWEKDIKDKQQIMEQVWFVGVHSDIGGGYIPAGLSDLALEWMRDKAIEAGLALHELATQPNYLQPCGQSRKGFYRLFPPLYRPIDQKSELEGKITCEKLHPSVLLRYKEDSAYRPKNLEEYLERNPQVLED